VTAELKPPIEAIVIVLVTLAPAVMVAVLADVFSEKSLLTTRVIGVDLTI
jgi:hypothetical protein